MSFTIGIIGGGQLGRMLAQAAQQYGFNVHIYAPQADCPAMQVTPYATVAAYDDKVALAAFAAQVDVVTFEFENIPATALHGLETPIYPAPNVLAISQDRLLEKQLAVQCGYQTAPFMAVDSLEDFQQAAATIGFPAIIKTRRDGYDGKGQMRLQHFDDIMPAWEKLAGIFLLYEGYVKFSKEISVLIARDRDGATALFPVNENQHRQHILDVVQVPAGITSQQAAQAMAMAEALADALGLVGLLAVEMFVTANGVVFNEMAPRPHNSGHWTLDACATSQFHQLIRCLVGWPLGDTTPLASKVRMKNLLGEDMADMQQYIVQPASRLHLYGKRGAVRGRKMGHVTAWQ